MILLHRPNGTPLWLHVAHIVTLEPTPDTIITLFGGDKLRVRESSQEVVDAAFACFARIGHPSVVPYVDPAHGRPSDLDKDE